MAARENDQVVDTYRLIASGLRARASEKTGQLDAAARSLEVRHAILEAGMKNADREEYVRALTLVEAQLAEDAVERHDAGAASAAIGQALEHADNLHARAKGTVDVDQIDVLWLAAELSALAHVKPAPDLSKRLEQADKDIVAQGSPALRSHQRWLEIYLTLTGADREVMGRERRAGCEHDRRRWRDSAAHWHECVVISCNRSWRCSKDFSDWVGLAVPRG